MNTRNVRNLITGALVAVFALVLPTGVAYAQPPTSRTPATKVQHTSKHRSTKHHKKHTKKSNHKKHAQKKHHKGAKRTSHTARLTH